MALIDHFQFEFGVELACNNGHTRLWARSGCSCVHTITKSNQEFQISTGPNDYGSAGVETRKVEGGV